MDAQFTAVKVSAIDWKWIIICVLAVALAFILGRAYQGRVVDNLAQTNQMMAERLQKTEQILKQVPWNAEAIQTWRGLQYDIPLPKPQPQAPPPVK
jgi:phosphate/sulfate permease